MKSVMLRLRDVAAVVAMGAALWAAWSYAGSDRAYREALHAASQPGAFPCRPTGASVPDMVRASAQPFGDALDHDVESSP